MHSSFKRASLLTALVALGVSSLEARAQAIATFDFPAQPLVESLRAVASQTQFNVFFEPKLVAGRQAPALKAQLTTEDALRELLKGTGLTYQLVDDKTFKIVAARAEAISSASGAYHPISAQWQGAATQAAAEPERSIDVLSEVIVTGKIDFSENDAFGATKMGLSILDTPQTITVLTSDMMEVMNIRNLDDVNRVLPGSSRTHDFQGGENFYFRGFQNDQGNTLRMDGFRYYSSSKLPPLLFDRIEVIQGATSTVYGQNNPAGTINVVSKVPEKEFAVRVRADAGSNEYYNGDVDLTGPIGDSNWAYRLLAGAEQYGTQYDYSHDDKLVGAATLQYQDSTKKFFVRLSHHDRDATAMRTSYFQFDRALPAGTTVAAALAGGLVDIVPLDDVPRSRYLGMPWSYQDAEVNAVQAQFDYSFENDWVVRAHYQNMDETTGFGLFEVLGPISVAGNGQRERLMSNAWDSSTYGMEMNLFGPFTALGREHTLFFGVDYSSIEYFSRTNSGFYGNNYAGTRFNVFAPDYSVYSRDDLNTFAGATSTNRNRNAEELVYSGAMAQVVLHPIDRLSVLLGARYSYDTVKSRLVSANNVSDAQIDALTAAASPTYQQYKNSIGQVGLTYEIFDKVNLYASYGETFTPTSEREFVDGLTNGREVGTQEGYNAEVGIKMEIAQWSTRLTAFDARRTNITQSDSAHPGFVLAIGEQVGRGVESVVQGQMMPRLNVFAGVTYLDAEYTEGEFAGMRPPSAPDLSLSLFSTYEFEDFLPGFGAGVGVTYKHGLEAPDRTYRDVDGGVYTVDLGDITEVDARLFYSLGNWDFYLVGSNLLDERYVTASNTTLNSNTHINPGREVRVGVKYMLGPKSR